MNKGLMELRAIASRRAGELRRIETEAIKGLPAHSVESRADDGKQFCNIYHEVTPEGESIVVVQAVRNKWFGIAYDVAIDGFVMAMDGTRRNLTEPETRKYD